MAGEIVYEYGTNPLSKYSYRKKAYPTMDRIETELNIMEISLDGDVGEIKASYIICYSDSSGKILLGSGADPYMPAIWILEKQGEEWVIAEIHERP